MHNLVKSVIYSLLISNSPGVYLSNIKDASQEHCWSMSAVGDPYYGLSPDIKFNLQSRYMPLITFVTLITQWLHHLDFFLVRPGVGEEFVYSPIEVNATIHCAVNNTNLVWNVDGLATDSEVARPVFNSRGIFQSTTIASERIMNSILIVFGNEELNNNSRICCQSLVGLKLRDACTTLIIYGMVWDVVCFFSTTTCEFYWQI